jgi:hypothetical protein
VLLLERIETEYIPPFFGTVMRIISARCLALIPTACVLLAGCHVVDTQKGTLSNNSSPTSITTEKQTAQCNSLFIAQQQNALKLTLREFDQDPKGGWRVLENEKCFSEAAKLILFYIDGTKSQHSQLWFHAGQLLASAGEYPAAVREFKKSLMPADANSGLMVWNDYVLGTIAFLQRDRQALMRRRDALAARKIANDLNLKVLNQLLERFEKSYDDALG